MDLASRRLFLGMVARRQRPGAGSDLAYLMRRERVEQMWWKEVVDALRTVPCAVVGGVAVAKYASQRETQGLDLVVAVSEAGRAEHFLKARGFDLQGQLSIGGTSWRTPGGNPVDLLYLPQTWAAKAIALAQNNRLLDLPVLPLPYLVLLKLESGRAVDLADLTRMLGSANEETLGSVRGVVALNLSREDLQDLEQMIAIGKMEWNQGLQRRKKAGE